MKLYYVHDPMCSWCWAFRPILLEIKNHLPKDIEFVSLLGGLAPDSDEPMLEETRQYVIDNWLRIQEQVPDTQFNYDFWKVCKPRRSTYPACRAVIAAQQQGEAYGDAMTYAIQQAYYLQARNPSDNITLIELAEEIGLNKKQFSEDLISEKINTELIKEIKTARELQLNSFPSFLLLKDNQGIHIQHNYSDAEIILEELTKQVSNG